VIIWDFHRRPIAQWGSKYWGQRISYCCEILSKFWG